MDRFIRILISAGIVLSSLTIVVAQHERASQEEAAAKKEKVAVPKTDEPEGPDDTKTAPPTGKRAPMKKSPEGDVKKGPKDQTKKQGFFKRLFGKKAKEPKKPE